MTGRWHRGSATALAWAALALAIGVGPADAEVRRIEEVGTVPLRADGSGIGAARDAAKQAGLRAAIERVARSFLDEVEVGAAPGSDGLADVDLRKVLGKRMVPYTTRFRVLEDRGERPAMFRGKGTTEYVVVVEVFVDADRVQQRLVDAGLLQQDPLAGEVSRVEIELRGIRDYAALTAVRELLIERVGAAEAVPLRFEQGVAVLEVELAGSDADAALLADQMVSLGAPELVFRALEVDSQRAVLDVRWSPPASTGARKR